MHLPLYPKTHPWFTISSVDTPVVVSCHRKLNSLGGLSGQPADNRRVHKNALGIFAFTPNFNMSRSPYSFLLLSLTASLCAGIFSKPSLKPDTQIQSSFWVCPWTNFNSSIFLYIFLNKTLSSQLLCQVL